MKIYLTKQQAWDVENFKRDLSEGEVEFAFVGSVEDGLAFLKRSVS